MASKALVPKLRFPEFRDAWGQVPLNELTDLVNERVGNSECVPYTVTSGIGLVSQNDKYGRTIAGKSIVNYIRLRQNDFAYNKSATKAYPEGYIARFTGDDKAAVPNSIFTCFRIKLEGIDPAFLDFQFAGNLHGRWLRELLTVGARAHGSLNVSDDDLMSLPVPIPVGPTGHAEQVKIADCLTSLDELIVAEGRKLEALRTFKKGLLQNLFPREHETTPRLRFPEFRNTGDWKENPLGELVSLLPGYPFDGKDIVEDSSGVPLLRGINITEGTIRHSSEIDRYYHGPMEGLDKYHVQEGDLVIGMDGSKVGRNSALISKVDSGALLIQRVARLRPNPRQSINFIFQQIHSARFHAYVDRINTSSGIPHISAKQINEYLIHVAPEQEEQKRVASCFYSLDALITAHSKKLNMLKLHKQALMQSLFPLGEANG